MNILGISCYFHDAAAALVQDGKIVAAAQEERFSRRKHDSRFPRLAIDFCLEHARIGGQDVDYVVFYEKPLVKFERILQTYIATFPRSWRSFTEAMSAWLEEKLWIKSRLVSEFGIPADRILFTDHHSAHAASAFFCSPFEEAAILTIDGVGEWSTATMGIGRSDLGGSTLRVIRDLKFPHSLGLLYSSFTAFLGFEVNEGEYKVMGMAPYGRPRFVEDIYRFVRVFDDGSIWLDMDYFEYHRSPDRMFSSKFMDLFGEPRRADEPFVTIDTDGDAGGPVVERSRRYADIAASIQRVAEDIVLRMAHQLHKDTGLTRLCFAGGVALNSVINGRLLRESPFDELFIHPAAGDAGGAVGAALYVWHVVLGKPRTFVLEDAYLGPQFTDAEIVTTLRQDGVAYEQFSSEDVMLDHVTEALVAGQTVGWFQGRGEWGPRALGNRSILADPRRIEMKAIVNSKIKFREPFRPFAPAVPEHAVATLFDCLREPARQYPARFMLLVLPWKEDAGVRVPAVNHLGTGRLQSVRQEWNPRYYGLLERFDQATGVPVLLNTSFNLRGEPMVNTPGDALATFRRSGLDLLVMGNCMVRSET